MKALLWKSSVSTYVADLSWLINFSRTERCFYFWQLLGSEHYTARLTAVTAWPRKEPPCMDLFRKSWKVCKGALQTPTSLPRTFHRGRVTGRSRSSRIPFLNRQSLMLECEKKKKKKPDPGSSDFHVKNFWKKKKKFLEVSIAHSESSPV